MGITAPMYAVHAHARSWRTLDSLALLLSIAGALQGRRCMHVICTYLLVVCTYLLNPFVHITPSTCLGSSLPTSLLALRRILHAVLRSCACKSVILIVHWQVPNYHLTLVSKLVAIGRLAGCKGGGLPAS